MYPYVYFFIEELETVFAYHIQSENHRTPSEIFPSKHWKRYELKSKKQFKLFSHKLRTPISKEGEGIFIGEDERIFIIKEINRQIQLWENGQ